MNKPRFTQEQLAQVAKLSDSDIKRVNENRGMQNKLGFAYQVGIDIMLLSHISPIAWSNVILYEEYKLNKDMVR
ncbi:MAG: DUF4158 domain-containing protein [Candidatus Methanoperedens sp.]|nr:DUF4158 domain-containing protein [Candidatus Methanoperedens sp.]